MARRRSSSTGSKRSGRLEDVNKLKFGFTLNICQKMLKKAPKLKYIIKTKSKSTVNMRMTSEAMVELATLLFLNSLAEEAKSKAFEEKCATIRSQHLRAVSKKMLKKSRG